MSINLIYPSNSTFSGLQQRDCDSDRDTQNEIIILSIFLSSVNTLMRCDKSIIEQRRPDIKGQKKTIADYYWI